MSVKTSLDMDLPLSLVISAGDIEIGKAVGEGNNS